MQPGSKAFGVEHYIFLKIIMAIRGTDHICVWMPWTHEDYFFILTYLQSSAVQGQATPQVLFPMHEMFSDPAATWPFCAGAGSSPPSSWLMSLLRFWPLLNSEILPDAYLACKKRLRVIFGRASWYLHVNIATSTSCWIYSFSAGIWRVWRMVVWGTPRFRSQAYLDSTSVSTKFSSFDYFRKDMIIEFNLDTLNRNSYYIHVA